MGIKNPLVENTNKRLVPIASPNSIKQLLIQHCALYWTSFSKIGRLFRAVLRSQRIGEVGPPDRKCAQKNDRAVELQAFFDLLEAAGMLRQRGGLGLFFSAAQGTDVIAF